MSSSGLVADLQLKVATAGHEGYSGLLFLCHSISSKVIVQWTGSDVQYDTKCKIESDIYSLFKGGCPGPEEIQTPIIKEELEKLGQAERIQPHSMSLSRPGATTSRVSAETEALIESDCRLNGQAPFVCKHCQQNFRLQRIFRAHVRKHYTRFLCDCGRLSRSRQVLMKHRQLRQCPGNNSGEQREMVEVDEYTYKSICSERSISLQSKFGKGVFTWTDSISVAACHGNTGDAEQQDDAKIDSKREMVMTKVTTVNESKEQPRPLDDGDDNNASFDTTTKIKESVVTAQEPLQATPTDSVVLVDFRDDKSASSKSLPTQVITCSVPSNSSSQSKSNQLSQPLRTSTNTRPLISTVPPRPSNYSVKPPQKRSFSTNSFRAARTSTLIPSTYTRQHPLASSSATLAPHAVPRQTQPLISTYSLSTNCPSSYKANLPTFMSTPLLSNPLLSSPQRQPLISSSNPAPSFTLRQHEPASGNSNASQLFSMHMRDRPNFLLGAPCQHMAESPNSRRPILDAPPASHPLLPLPFQRRLTPPTQVSQSMPLLPLPRHGALTPLETALLSNSLSAQPRNYM
ncbi:serine-rich adhesin for platelets-like [Watersipora subatra]|uniref:serine-rich adhesin for platelets-like n=1 Tax=Watersipora subatra TaxID=2589382 RepID=UPI00355B6BBB